MAKSIGLACIIDDDEIYTFVLEKLMHIHQFTKKVLTFPDGKKALDSFSTMIPFPDRLPDVIFLDIEMHVMSGWQFLEGFSKIRPQLKKDIPIYIISTSVYKRDMMKAKSYTEVSDYLIKPLTKEDLNRVLDEIQNLDGKMNDCK